MIIFLYGQDSYGRQKKIKELTDQYRKKNPDIEIERFNFEEESELNQLIFFFQSPTLFASTKLAIAENIFTITDTGVKNKKLFKNLLKGNLENKDFILLISEEKKPAKDFDFLLKKPALAQEFKELKGRVWIEFVNNEIKNRQKENLLINFPAIQKDYLKNYLIRNFESDGWGLINELEKLILINFEKNKNAVLEAIAAKTTDLEGNNFFQRIREFLYSHSLAQKIPQLEILLASEDPAKIFNLLASFSSNPLSLTKKFADYDILIKSGKIDYEEALLDLALSATI